MDVLGHQRHCTCKITPSRSSGLRHVVVHKLIHQALANYALLSTFSASFHSKMSWSARAPNSVLLMTFWSSIKLPLSKQLSLPLRMFSLNMLLCISVHICFGKVSAHIRDHADVEVVLGKRLMSPKICASIASPYSIAFSSFSNSSCFRYCLQHLLMVAPQCWMIWRAQFHCCSSGFSAGHWWRSVRCNALSSNHVQTFSMRCSCCGAVSSSSYIIGCTGTPLVIRPRCFWAAAARAIRVA